MAIVFRCKSCDARFEVDARLAGRTGRCKKCGAPMSIPRASEESSRVAAPAAAGAVVRRDAPAPGPIPGRPMNWIEAVTSQVALKPITVAAIRPVARSTPLDDAEDSNPYEFAGPPPTAPPARTGSRPAGRVTMAYRGRMGDVARFFRWINESAYLISVPFLMVLLLGVILQNRSLAILGATAVVLLNIGRLVSGLANLVAIPFREGPIQGVLFLIPPLTFLYLYQHWKRMRKPVGRIVEPVFTIGLVVLAFTFLPSLATEKPVASGRPGDRIRAGARDLGQEIRGKLPDVDTDKVKDKASQAVRDVGERLRPAPEPSK
jgi:hypothetical protein